MYRSRKGAFVRYRNDIGSMERKKHGSREAHAALPLPFYPLRMTEVGAAGNDAYFMLPRGTLLVVNAARPGYNGTSSLHGGVTTPWTTSNTELGPFWY